MHIVVADSNSADRAQLQRDLERLGPHEVLTVDGGTTAVQVARERQPDLVVLGFDQPWNDTLDAVRTLAHDHFTPVLLWMSCSDLDAVDAAVEAGAAGYLPRDYTPPLLRALVRFGLAGWQAKRDLEQEKAALADKLETQHLFGRAKAVLVQRCPGMTEDEAHRTIQQRSMRTRTPIRVVAEAILLADATMSQTASASLPPKQRRRRK
jgi:AmiR/NasT family two-component response regulator